MQSGAVTLGKVFAADQQNVIPLFQRPYVWSADANWAPLWDDVRLATEQEATAQAASPMAHADKSTYFLGAIVLQYRPKHPAQVFLWNVVDGQQRLTTLQVLIASARRVALELGAPKLAATFGSLVENNAAVIHENFPDDMYKVWPLPQDRHAFVWAVSATDANDPPPESGHALIKARYWFDDAIRTWASGTADPETSLYHLVNTLRDRMQIIQIELEPHDDPQVIFEVLNHRGVPLDAVDLVKNLLFQQLEHAGKSPQAEKLLAEVWLPLDRAPWRDEIITGRVRRRRADVLLTYWLVIASQKEVMVDHLFADFRTWMLEEPRDATEVIRSIRSYADTMSQLRSLHLPDPTAQLIDRMEVVQATTPWPVLLYLHHHLKVPAEQRRIAVEAIDSFIMRRGVCKLPAGDYNRLFLIVLSAAMAADPLIAGEAVRNTLLAQVADSRRWPTDDEFVAALSATNLFNVVLRARLRSMLLGIEYRLRDDKVDPVPFLSASDKSVNIEHVMPQNWEKGWPLAQEPGSFGYDEALERRKGSIHQLGNLTLLTTKFNTIQSNKPWSAKRKDLAKNALLQLTTASVLSTPAGVLGMDDAQWVSAWNEDRIDARGHYLRKLALQVWPRPSGSS